MRPPFALVTAWRESRGSRRRLTLYLASVSLGVAALVAINSFRANVAASVHAQARTLLGADLELRSRKAFPDSVESLLDSLRRSGASLARVTSFASMALATRSGRARLVEVRAVGGGFPFYGTIATTPPGRWTALAEGSKRAVLVDPAVLVYLEAAPGDTVQLGDARFVIGGVVTDVPGDVSLWSAIGPRVFLPARYLGETHLLRFGSMARYRAYLRLAEADVQPLLNRYNRMFQRYGIGSDTVSEQEEDLTQALGRMARYLGLVGLVALLLGGLGVASAVNVFVTDKLDSAALLRCLGARQRTVLAVYLVQAVALGVGGAGAGVVLGVLVQLSLPALLGEFLPLDVAVAPHWATIASGLGIGVATAVLFALLPLLQLKDVSPLRVLRRDLDAPARRAARWRRLAVYAVMIAGLVTLARWQAPGRVVGWAFAAAVLVTLAALWLTAQGLMRGTRRWFPRGASYVIRQGIANLFRPQNQTVAVVLAIGFGVFLIATLYVVQRSLVAQFALDARPDRPNLVFFDVQPDEKTGVARMLAARARPGSLDLTPIVPARIARVNGRRIDSLRTDSLRRPSPWALRREYRNTYRDTLVSSERLTAGSWWTAPRRRGERPRISLEAELAASLGVGVGDRITWNVQGALLETQVASLREVEWARFQPNFFVVFEPGVLERAPQTFVLLARADEAAVRAELQRDVTRAHPGVSSLDLTLVQRTLDGLLSKVTLAIRFMALFSIASGLVILVGALTASRLQRAREAVLLKTLGASGRQVRAIFLTEYCAWGSFAALTGVLLASVGGWAVMTRLFELPFRLPALPLLGVWIGVCVLVAAIGLAHSHAVTRGTPLGLWRGLSE